MSTITIVRTVAATGLLKTPRTSFTSRPGSEMSDSVSSRLATKNTPITVA